MKRPLFLNAASVLAVLLSLSSTSAQGASRRGGATSVENQAAAQSTAAHSAQQQGSVDSNSSAEGSARRTRTGSFARKSVEPTKKTAASRANVIAKTRVNESDRALTSHLIDVETFVLKTASEGPNDVRLLAKDLLARVSSLIFEGAETEAQSKMFALVDELSKTDEEALHALLLLANYRLPTSLLKTHPEFSDAIDRLAVKMKESGFALTGVNGSWLIDAYEISPAILAAPGARTLLGRLTDSNVQRQNRKAIAQERANILNAANAERSIELMQTLKSYINSMYERAGVDILDPLNFMSRLKTNRRATANGGVLLVFKDTPYPVEIRTAHGSIAYTGPANRTSYRQADEFFERYKEELGLELIDERQPLPLKTFGFTVYAVTRLPDGTKLPKAKPVDRDSVYSVSRSELEGVVLQVPENARQGIRVDSN